MGRGTNLAQRTGGASFRLGGTVHCTDPHHKRPRASEPRVQVLLLDDAALGLLILGDAVVGVADTVAPRELRHEVLVVGDDDELEVLLPLALADDLVAESLRQALGTRCPKKPRWLIDLSFQSEPLNFFLIFFLLRLHS